MFINVNISTPGFSFNKCTKIHNEVKKWKINVTALTEHKSSLKNGFNNIQYIQINQQ